MRFLFSLKAAITLAVLPNQHAYGCDVNEMSLD